MHLFAVAALVALLCTSSCHGTFLNSDALMLNELHSVFGVDTELLTLNTLNGGTLTCTDNRVIVWGYHIQYHHRNADNDCLRNNNKACPVGGTSCQVPYCAMQDNQSRNKIVGRIVMLCGRRQLADSYMRSVVVTNHQAGEVTCDAGDKIVFGFKYQYSTNILGCPASNFGPCSIGDTSCALAAQSTTACLKPTAVVNILCGPKAFADFLKVSGAFEIEKDVGNNPTKLSCPPQGDSGDVITAGANYGPKSTLLTGVTLSLAEKYYSSQVNTLINANSICKYGKECARLETNSRDERLEGGFALCVPAIVLESPSNAPVSTPSRKLVGNTKSPTINFLPVTAAPTSLPTSTPSSSPSYAPTLEPTTYLENSNSTEETTGSDGLFSNPIYIFGGAGALGLVFFAGISKVGYTRYSQKHNSRDLRIADTNLQANMPQGSSSIWNMNALRDENAHSPGLGYTPSWYVRNDPKKAQKNAMSSPLRPKRRVMNNLRKMSVFSSSSKNSSKNSEDLRGNSNNLISTQHAHPSSSTHNDKRGETKTTAITSHAPRPVLPPRPIKNKSFFGRSEQNTSFMAQNEQSFTGQNRSNLGLNNHKESFVSQFRRNVENGRKNSFGRKNGRAAHENGRSGGQPGRNGDQNKRKGGQNTRNQSFLGQNGGKTETSVGRKVRHFAPNARKESFVGRMVAENEQKIAVRRQNNRKESFVGPQYGKSASAASFRKHAGQNDRKESFANPNVQNTSFLGRNGGHNESFVGQKGQNEPVGGGILRGELVASTHVRAIGEDGPPGLDLLYESHLMVSPPPGFRNGSDQVAEC